jgi:hypothetical protein
LAQPVLLRHPPEVVQGLLSHKKRKIWTDKLIKTARGAGRVGHPIDITQDQQFSRKFFLYAVCTEYTVYFHFSLLYLRKLRQVSQVPSGHQFRISRKALNDMDPTP